MEDAIIRDLSHFTSLWEGVYTTEGKPNWDHMLPYYHDEITFRDSVQTIKGKEEFTQMTRRLAKRSKNLQFLIHNSLMEGNLIFVEWEMIISYKKYPKSSVYGASRVILKEGKVIEQRDYYDLWGDIFDNISFMRKGYRRFMKRKFG